jgi:predicted nucleotidyltransferase component of viral defense system
VNAGAAASIHARLLALAKSRGEDFNFTLNRYALERFLYRLSISPTRDQYWLKGALLFDLWFDVPHRPTRDADFLGFGPADADAVRKALGEVCRIEVADAMAFDPGSIAIEEIREDARYGGLRVRIAGSLGKARCAVQLDIGYGDAVTPGPEEVEYPTLLPDQAAPRLQAYPRAAVVAEKLEAIVSLGMANSRMKDYFDLRALAREGAIDSKELASAVAATFARRKTRLPEDLPLGLSDEFARDDTKKAQWKGFLGKNRLEAPSLEEVVADVRRFAHPALQAAFKQRGGSGVH